MKLIATSSDLKEQLERLIENYSKYYWAVAWASPGHDLTKRLYQKRKNIKKMVIGRNGYVTDPNFIQKFMCESTIRYMPPNCPLFHPKIYLFSNSDKCWECLIGSPNFTESAFSSNTEIAVLLDNNDNNSDQIYKDILERIDAYWLQATVVDEKELEHYKKQRKEQSGRNILLIQELPSEFIMDIDWKDYYALIQSEKEHSLKGRIEILNYSRKIFASAPRFSELPLAVRKNLAGIKVKSENKLDWGWFGQMFRAEEFNKLISDGDLKISSAIDEIPLNDNINKSHFNNYYKQYCEAFYRFKNKGIGIATFTRLLALKRPDYFVCIGGKNIRKLCESFRLKPANIHPENYWDIIIEKVRTTKWWKSPPPVDELEKSAWLGRVALLDAIFYEK